MKDVETLRVKLENLKPFSGVLYDENNVGTKIEGNPFYVPQDYLPTTESAEAESGEGATEEGKPKEKPSEAVASLRRLHASIEAEGLLTPILVRPAKSGNPEEYEILSGYRRKRVCEELAKTNPDYQEIPAVVLDCDDDTASAIITSSNVQRQSFSLLDKIKSCGRMYRAMAHRGKANQEGEGYTAHVVAKVTGINARNVVRYAALIGLPEEMLELVGNKVKNSAGDIRLSVTSGVTLSSVGERKLAVINHVLMENKDSVIMAEQATELKNACAGHADITESEVKKHVSLNPSKKDEVKPKKLRLALNSEKIQSYCPDMSKTDIEKLIYKLLEKWKKSSDRKQERLEKQPQGQTEQQQPENDGQSQ